MDAPRPYGHPSPVIAVPGIGAPCTWGPVDGVRRPPGPRPSQAAGGITTVRASWRRGRRRGRGRCRRQGRGGSARRRRSTGAGGTGRGGRSEARGDAWRTGEGCALSGACADPARSASVWARTRFPRPPLRQCSTRRWSVSDCSQRNSCPHQPASRRGRCGRPPRFTPRGGPLPRHGGTSSSIRGGAHPGRPSRAGRGRRYRCSGVLGLRVAGAPGLQGSRASGPPGQIRGSGSGSTRTQRVPV